MRLEYGCTPVGFWRYACETRKPCCADPPETPAGHREWSRYSQTAHLLRRHRPHRRPAEPGRMPGISPTHHRLTGPCTRHARWHSPVATDQAATMLPVRAARLRGLGRLAAEQGRRRAWRPSTVSRETPLAGSRSSPGTAPRLAHLKSTRPAPTRSRVSPWFRLVQPAPVSIDSSSRDLQLSYRFLCRCATAPSRR